MSKTALLLLDLQQGILERFGDDMADYLSCVSKTINAARAAGISIIYIRTCFRPGHPEISSRNLSIARIASLGDFVEGDESVGISPSIAPLERDMVVSKRRVSAFSGSDLDGVLRGLTVDSPVLAGVATSGAVFSTVRQAADLDFSLTVLGDLCLDLDAEVHRVLVEKVFPRQARILGAEQWIQGLSSSSKE